MQPTLTPAQKTTLKNAALAESSIAQAIADGNTTAVATWFNSAPATAFVVWRTDVSKAEIIASSAFDWTRVDNLTIGKARIWSELFSAGNINPSQLNVRNGIDATWTAAADLPTLTGIYVVIKRNATIAEKLLATGTGTNGSPATMTAYGPVSTNEVSAILS